MEQEATMILQVVATDTFKNLIKNIISEKVTCVRHAEYLDQGRLHSGMGPFTLFNDLVRSTPTAIVGME